MTPSALYTNYLSSPDIIDLPCDICRQENLFMYFSSIRQDHDVPCSSLCSLFHFKYDPDEERLLHLVHYTSTGHRDLACRLHDEFYISTLSVVFMSHEM